MLSATKPGYFGWPFCIAGNSPYINWDYTQPNGKQNKGYFTCNTSTKIDNRSKWNTGESVHSP